MEKKYDKIEEQTAMVSEPLAEYGVMKSTRRKIRGLNSGVVMDTDTISIEQACEMTLAAVREEYATL